jgi:hypothetical protein
MPVALLALSACNQPPDAPQIALNPGQPTTTDDIAVLFLAITTDGNARDEVSHSFQWFQDGTLRPDLTTDTVPASETTKGQVWKVVVVPNDGRVDGTAAEASATVLNTPPVGTVALAADPATDVDLVADVTSEDADADTVTYTYAWTRDGAPTELAGFSIPAAETTHGETWTVTVTPNDGEADGEPVSATIVVANSAPIVDSVELSPTPAFEDSLVTAAVVGADDLDADEITFTYTWLVDDVEVQSGQDDTLTGAFFSKHQLVRVEVTPNDGFVDGAVVTSADLLIENTAPAGTGAVIVSSSADGAVYESSTATCVPSGWSDVDGDTEGWTYVWTVDGVEVSTAQTVDGTVFSRDQTLTCTATPFDGEASGAPLTSAAVTVSNTVPVLSGASLSTLTPTENDTVTVTLGSIVDDDGDAVVYGYDWYVEGSVVSTSSALLPNRFAKGDSIQAVVTPFDGTGYGSAVTSDTATGTNTPPVATRVTLSPTEVYTDDTLTATVAATDVDGDTLTYAYDWYVDGFPRGSTTSASLSGATWFDRDQDVYVVVTPNDGEADGTSATSDTVTVSNSAPTAPVVEITPADAVAGDDLTCSVVTESTDADGDAITYAFAWDVDGVAYSDAIDSAMSSVVDGGDVGEAEAWTCSVTATSDGQSAEGEASTIVAPGCDEYAFSGSTYYFCMQEALTWSDAQVFCERVGGHLVVINTGGEWSFVNDTLNADYPYCGPGTCTSGYPGGTIPWIGYSDSATEGVWVWVTGESGYADWQGGEPNRGTSENCADFNQGSSQGYRDNACSEQLSFICEN